MVDQAFYDRLDATFAALLEDLSATWPAEDIEYVKEEVGHGEYGDALENLVAFALRGDRKFSDQQVKQVRDLAEAMGMTDDLVVRLRESVRQKRRG